MIDPQQETIDMLVSQGYVIERNSVWPVYWHPVTGTTVAVDFEGRQIEAGYRAKEG